MKPARCELCRFAKIPAINHVPDGSLVCTEITANYSPKAHIWVGFPEEGPDLRVAPTFCCSLFEAKP